MTKQEITFHNKTDLKVQAQIFAGRLLIATYPMKSGESCTTGMDTTGHDIFFRDGTTGREIARKLDNSGKSLTLSKTHDGWYDISDN